MVVRLELSDVGLRYGDRTVLAGITTPPLPGGEVVAVIGPNAAGKSSLLRRIAGLARGTGEVKASGTSAVPERARPAMCYLPQDTASSAVLTVYESVLVAIKGGGSWRVSDAQAAVIDAVLAEIDIADLAFRRLDTLSGGQRQLVSIAQTLAREPDVLLLDEPTSALDLHRQFEVLTLLRRRARERRTCILVSIHDLNQAMRFADRIIVLAGGRLASVGPPHEVVTPRLLADVYGVRGRIETRGGDSVVVVDGSLRAGAHDDPRSVA